MWKNYLKIAWRNMKRNRIYSLINIIGLSLGMTASVLIFLFVFDELSYDQTIPHADRIYRVNVSGKLNGNEFISTSSAAPLGPAMKEEIAQVEDFVRMGVLRTYPLIEEEKAFTESIVMVADLNFLDFFGLELLSGNRQSALNGPNKIVLTKTVAEKYFGEEDPVGKTILGGAEKIQLEVTGVMADMPTNTHLDLDAVISGENWWFFEQENWTTNNLLTYYRIAEGADPDAIQEILNDFVIKYVGAELLQFLGVSIEAFLAQGNAYGLISIPMLDIYLNSNASDEIKSPGNLQYLYLFSGIAIFILLIACINFMNLSTARSANRAKEVGVRKSIGANRKRLIWQFLAESLIYSAIAGALTSIVILLVLQPFNLLSEKSLSAEIFLDLRFIGIFLAFLLIVGLLAGSYPAFYLTSFSPVGVLKGEIRSGVKRSVLRSGLVIFQFFVSIALMISSLVVYSQLKFTQEKNLGIDKENVLALLHVRSLGANEEAFKQEVLAQSGFVAAAYSNVLPPRIDWTSLMRTKDKQQDVLCYINYVDEDYLDALGFKLTSGRFFSREIPSDTGALLVNQTAMALMGWEELDGTQEVGGFWNDDETVTYRKVIGVIEDFNFESLRQNVRPLVVMNGGENTFNEMAIRISPGQVSEKIQLLESVWKKHAGGAPFEYLFLDEDFDRLFHKEQKMSQIILVFTGLAIGIACLGLFGLAAYTTEQRSKEISIRKTLGASMANLVAILSKDFTLLVAIAFVIAGPVSYLLLERCWLQNFAYRIEIGPGLIFLAGMVAVVIAWLTVSYQSFRTAASNPVDYLKSE
jgi:putative ABC transport system permease protein